MFCKQPVWYYDVNNKWQKVHTKCAVDAPTDFHYKQGDFELYLRSTLIPPYKLKKIFSKLK